MNLLDITIQLSWELGVEFRVEFSFKFFGKKITITLFTYELSASGIIFRWTSPDVKLRTVGHTDSTGHVTFDIDAVLEAEKGVRRVSTPPPKKKYAASCYARSERVGGY